MNTCDETEVHHQQQHMIFNIFLLQGGSIISRLCRHSRGSLHSCRRTLGQVLHPHQETPQHLPLHVSDRQQLCLHTLRGAEHYAGIFNIVKHFLSLVLDHRDSLCSWLELQDLHCCPSLASHPHLQHQESQVPLSLLCPRQHPGVCWSRHHLLLHLLNTSPQLSLSSMVHQS